MTILKLNFYQIFILLLFQFYGLAQPSFSVHVNFKFYNESKLITSAEFNKKYKLIDNTWHKNDSVNYAYDIKNQTYNFNRTIVYNDIRMQIVKAKDTMQLVFKTNGSIRRKFKVERLDFKEGTFIIDADSINSLDLKNSKSNYYNYILSLLPIDTTQIQKNINFIELNKLKLKYGITDEDYKTKSENELIVISNLKDDIILAKYSKYLSINTFGEEDGNDRFIEEKITYSTDNKFKIFVFKGESCGGNCATFYKSFIHFNLDKKNPTVLSTDFFPIDSILKIDSDNYLVFQSGYDGNGIYIYDYKIVTLVSFKNSSILIGNNYDFPNNGSTNYQKGFKIEQRQGYTDENKEKFYLKFNPKTNILQYKFWRFRNEETEEKRIYFGEAIFQDNHFRFISRAEGPMPK